jgi:hypothetical protein
MAVPSGEPETVFLLLLAGNRGVAMLQGLEIIEVAIGLMLVFLVLSIIVTAINELIAHFWSLRANNLYEGIESLIGKHLTKHLYLHTSVAGTANAKDRGGFLRGKKERPSYIEELLFVDTLFDLLVPADPAGKKLDIEQLHQAMASPADCPGIARIVSGEFGSAVSDKDRAELEAEIRRLRVALSPMLMAAEKMEDARSNVAKWYCRAMERNSGQYKRRIQLITVGVAVVLAVVLNLDALALSERLFVDDEWRGMVVEQANGVNHDSSVEGLEGGWQALDKMVLPVGWPDDELNGNFNWDAGFYDVSFALVSKILGLALTVAAISLGAPFWFDTLDKFMQIRSSGVVSGGGKES